MKPDNSSKETRQPRVKQFSLNEVKLLYRGATLQVINLSGSGLAVEMVNVAAFPAQGNHFEADLKINGNHFKFELETVRKSPNSVGCKFLSSTQELQKYLKHHFKIELAALNMTRVNNQILAPQPDGKPHWYFDGINSELYYIEHRDAIIRYRITWLDNELSGNTSGTKRFVKGGIEQKMPQNVKAELIRFIQHIEELPGSHKHFFLAQIDTV